MSLSLFSALLCLYAMPSMPLLPACLPSLPFPCLYMPPLSSPPFLPPFLCFPSLPQSFICNNMCRHHLSFSGGGFMYMSHLQQLHANMACNTFPDRQNMAGGFYLDLASAGQRTTGFVPACEPSMTALTLLSCKTHMCPKLHWPSTPHGIVAPFPYLSVASSASGL